MELFKGTAQLDWRWFEEDVTYDNAEARTRLDSERTLQPENKRCLNGACRPALADGIANLREGSVSVHWQQRILPPRWHTCQL